MKHRERGIPSSLYADGVRTFLVLDFDGAINQFPQDASLLEEVPPEQEVYSATREAPVHLKRFSADEEGVEVTVSWSAALIDALSEVLQRPEVQLVWNTYWNENILKVEGLLGLAPRRPSILNPIRRKFGDHEGSISKVQALGRFFEDFTGEEARLIWVDDEVIPFLLPSPFYDGEGALEERFEEEFADIIPQERRLLIPSHSVFGLLRPQVAALTAFAEGEPR